MIYEIKDYLRNNKFSSIIYMIFRTYRHKSRFTVYSEDLVNPIIDERTNYRINLIVPCFTHSMIFGGISTALKVFNTISDNLGFEKRIIVTGQEVYDKKVTYQLDGFSHNALHNGIFFLSENTTIKIRNNDIFIFTSWMTAFLFYPVYEWQKIIFKQNARKVIYLIQDYEPGFEPWSTEYVLSESTYLKGDSTMAIFNSNELHEYFLKNGYSFFKEISFAPNLNDKLKKILINSMDKKRRKRIIIYGRPVTSRNAFSLIYSALVEWARKYPKASEWEIISLGDKFIDIKLPTNKIKFMGKVSLDEYANIMLSAYIGISLMISPHPSYPPLEMSSFGVKTITNTFENKDLKNFNSNIISINSCTPKNIAETLIELCQDYNSSSSKIIVKGDYIEGNSFTKAMNQVISEIKTIENLN